MSWCKILEFCIYFLSQSWNLFWFTKTKHLPFSDSVRREWRGQWQKLCGPERHSHRHHGLHRARLLRRHRVPTDVGGVWVGEQGGRQHQRLGPLPVPAARHQSDQHEVSDPREGRDWVFLFWGKNMPQYTCLINGTWERMPFNRNGFLLELIFGDLYE